MSEAKINTAVFQAIEQVLANQEPVNVVLSERYFRPSPPRADEWTHASVLVGADFGKQPFYVEVSFDTYGDEADVLRHNYPSYLEAIDTAKNLDTGEKAYAWFNEARSL